jgi:hypothetical protein
MNSDVVGMNEIDAMGGQNSDCFNQLVLMMTELGYLYQYYD